MILNFLKIAIRNVGRQPFYSLINVVGLAVGLAACWFLTIYIFHEKQYDAFLPHTDRICMASLEIKMGDTEGQTTNTPPPLGLRLAADYPEVESTARVFNLGETLVARSRQNQAAMSFNESGVLAVDSTFLSLFGFEMLQGNASALNSPQSVVLTQAAALKYFGNEAALGQTLTFNERPFTVSGILKDLPTNASLRFEFLLPTKDFRVIEHFAWSWIWLQMDTWVKFKEPVTQATLAKFEAKMPAMVRKFAPAAFERIGQNFEDNLRKGDKYNVRFLPLSTLHLSNTGIDSRLGTLGDARLIDFFAVIGLVILLLACVNFINLSTARSIKRSREVGVRKALGSSRASLIRQFLVESSLMSLMALVVAAALTVALLPLFNQLTHIEFATKDIFRTDVLGVVLLLPLLTGLLAGLYPALYLSSFNTIDTMKKSTGKARGLVSVRSGLVVFQFSASIVLILGVFIVNAQLNFAQGTKAGLQKENVLVINNTRHFKNASDREVFRQKLLQTPGVLQVTHSTYLPSLGGFNDFYEPEQGLQAQTVLPNLAITSFLTDEHFTSTLKLELKAGRNFRQTGDSTSVILNETAVRMIGWKNPIGKWLRYPGNRNQRFMVVGVIKDFHLASVRTAIEPVALFHESSKTYQTWGSYMAVRVQPKAEKAVVEKATQLWKASIPTVPFEYDFLDRLFANMYRSESQTASILLTFTVLAILIACLGLFALATFSAEQRTKEIGIRKVLGASILSIMALISKDFLKLVLASNVIAFPIAYYLMSNWLQEFTYRVEISGWIFAMAGTLALLIAFLTVGYQSIKAALMNPVKSLKTE